MLKSSNLVETTKKGFKETEIGKIPKDWEVKKICEIDTSKEAVQTGPFGSLLHSYDYDEEGVPLLLVKNIEGGKLANNDLPLVNFKKAHQLKKFWLKEGDIVFTRVGAVGRTLYIDKRYEGWMFSGQTLRLRIKNPNVNNRFIEYYFRTPTHQSISNSTSLGTTRPSINTTILANTLIPVPSKNEQDKIASILGSLDDKIELNNQMNRTLEEMASAIFKRWFVDFEFPNEEGEPYKSSGGEMEYNEELGKEIPKGWGVKSLSEVCKTQYGYTQSAVEEPVGPKFLRVKDINKQDWVEWQEVPYCTISNSDFQKYKLHSGDIVVARMADPGKSAIIDENVNAVFASYLVRLKIPKIETSYYVYYFLKSKLYSDYAHGAMGGSVQKNMNAKVITGVKLVVPPYNIQKEFCHKAVSLRKKIITNETESRTLAAIRDTLLPKLMSGEIRVKGGGNNGS